MHSIAKKITRYIAAHAECVDCPGGVFLRDWNEMPEAHRDLILASSSVALHAGRGSLDRQIAASAAISPAPRFIPARDSEEEPATRLAARSKTPRVTGRRNRPWPGGGATELDVVTLKKPSPILPGATLQEVPDPPVSQVLG